MNIAIIPARGGSKRIPRKNIRPFCGQPMIAWSIGAARQSGLFAHIIVSTDDPDIASIALSHGAEVPFERPAELSDDYTGTTEVIAHATGWLMEQGWRVEAVCCLYATAPFVRVEDLRQGFELLKSGNWAFTFTAAQYAAPVFRSFCVHPEGGVEMLFPELFTTRSQDLPTVLHDAGQFYWGRPDAWLQKKRMFDRHSCPLLIPRWRVQDIDTEEDWKSAELLHSVVSRHRNG